MFRQDASKKDMLSDIPHGVRLIKRVVFDTSTYLKYSFDSRGYFHYYPWFSDMLVSNGLLWAYPEAQSRLLRQCMDVLPSITDEKKFDDGWDFRTRDAVRYRLSVSGAV